MYHVINVVILPQTNGGQINNLRYSFYREEKDCKSMENVYLKCTCFLLLSSFFTWFTQEPSQCVINVRKLGFKNVNKPSFSQALVNICIFFGPACFLQTWSIYLYRQNTGVIMSPQCNSIWVGRKWASGAWREGETRMKGAMLEAGKTWRKQGL